MVAGAATASPFCACDGAGWAMRFKILSGYISTLCRRYKSLRRWVVRRCRFRYSRSLLRRKRLPENVTCIAPSMLVSCLAGLILLVCSQAATMAPMGRRADSLTFFSLRRAPLQRTAIAIIFSALSCIFHSRCRLFALQHGSSRYDTVRPLAHMLSVIVPPQYVGVHAQFIQE